jgi:hypothetical protein
MNSVRKATALVAVVLVVSAVFAVAQGAPASAASVDPDFVSGNPSCTDLGYQFGFKPQPEPPPSGSYTFPDGIHTLTIISDGTYFDWSSTLGLDAVIVKGGPNANVYAYDPPAEAFSDTGLNAPINPNNNQPYAVSHIEVCYDYEVDVSKTAETSFTRTWSWTIDKWADQTELTLSLGQQFLVNYAVTVDATYEDDEFAVSGSISVFNPAPMDATITGVSDVVSPDIGASVDCGTPFPYTLGSGETLVCTYSTDLPDGSARTNTATVTTSGDVGGGEGTADVIFGDPTEEIDECVDVSDDKYGNLGIVCADSVPKTFNYGMYVGPYDVCGRHEFTNIASFVTNDTGTTDSETWTVTVDVPCAGGCTLTQGYWKTHSEYGPAPYDDTWAMLPNGADTPFFLSGQSYYEVLWTPPKGNAYYNLAHQYIAAELNVLNGAWIPVQALEAWNAATVLFSTYTPDEVAALKGKGGKVLRQQFISLAEILDDYNNGLIGPGHCSE